MHIIKIEAKKKDKNNYEITGMKIPVLKETCDYYKVREHWEEKEEHLITKLEMNRIIVNKKNVDEQIEKEYVIYVHDSENEINEAGKMLKMITDALEKFNENKPEGVDREKERQENEDEDEIILDPNVRWEKGISHHPKSIELYHYIKDIDFAFGDFFCFKHGGDGDNGEHLMYLMDSFFEEKDQKQEREEGEE